MMSCDGDGTPLIVADEGTAWSWNLTANKIEKLGQSLGQIDFAAFEGTKNVLVSARVDSPALVLSVLNHGAGQLNQLDQTKYDNLMSAAVTGISYERLSCTLLIGDASGFLSFIFFQRTD